MGLALLISGLSALIMCGWAIVQLSRGGQDAGDTSSIMAMVLGAVGLPVALAGVKAAWPQPDDALELAEKAAGTLAGRVSKAEGLQLRALVGADQERLTLTFTRRPYGRIRGEGPEHGQLEGNGPSAGPDYPDIATYYQSCTKPRLVITGAPGAGKTVLSVVLVRELIKQRKPGEPVPVRVPLAEWDTKVPFEKLLINHVIKAGISEERAIWIVEHQLVLPVLDGLDEMDPGRTDEDGNPVRGPDGQQLPDPRAPRALAALKALNEYGSVVAEQPLILMCRTDHYNSLPVAERLRHAVGIDIDPISYAQIQAHLTVLFEDDPRWRAFLDALPARWSHPQYGAGLRETLTTPWWLFLAKTVYNRNGDPSELFTCATTQALRDRLLALFIPAVVDSGATRYDAEKVRRWLSTIACHLQGGPVERVDIHQHQLWPIAGVNQVRYLDAAAAGLLFALLLLPVPLLAESPSPELIGLIGLFAALVAWEVARQAGDFPPCVPWGRVFSEATLSLLITGLPPAFALAALAGLVSLPAAWLFSGIGWDWFVTLIPTVTVLCSVRMGTMVLNGSGIGQAFGSMYPTDVNTAVRWRYVFRGDLLIGCLMFIAAGISTMTAWWVMSFSNTLMLTSVPGLDIAAVGLLAVSARWVMMFGGGRRHLVFLLCLQGQLPRRIGRFLKWSHQVGLLRTSGGAYQFRHREFQQWLAAGSPAGGGIT
ncbi:NACHT domain-containing protein [Streptomyces sp. KM77-8]|uniref:NACHT domain-containing protein n=1 Tax=Streptomyces haneummycinicus TaxID=3074435 RepID=A0AAT9HM44_9ACTN